MFDNVDRRMPIDKDEVRVRLELRRLPKDEMLGATMRRIVSLFLPNFDLFAVPLCYLINRTRFGLVVALVLN